MDSLAVILIIIGIGLLVLEIFIPSFGVTGLLGIVAILGGVILTAETFASGVIMFLSIMAVVLAMMFVFYKFIVSKRSPLILKDSVHEEEQRSDLNYFVNQTGVALTALRPSGKGDFEGVRLDVLTEGGFIQKGEQIVVTRIEGKKIIVESLKGSGE